MTLEPVVIGLMVVAFAFERLSNTFGVPSQPLQDKVLEKKELRFTSLMLGLYAFCVVSAVFNYFSFQPTINKGGAIFGVLLLIIGALIRRASIRAMDFNWSVYTVAHNISFVVTSGPFKYSRHPYYWASMMELLGLALFLGCWFSFIFAFVVYLPLLVFRSVREETNLKIKFPLEYVRYKRSSGFFIGVSKNDF